MEELIQKIDELINEISANSVPLWLSIVGIFVPILISIIVLWQGCRQNKRNLELQQQITSFWGRFIISAKLYAVGRIMKVASSKNVEIVPFC